MSEDTYMYIVIGIIILGVLFFIFKDKIMSEYFTTTSIMNEKLILKYFGSSRCPHSKVGSKAYLLVKEFEEKYKNVIVEYYWSDDELSRNEFTKANAEFVPTITNCDYIKIELILPKCDTPDCIELRDKKPEELKELLLEEILKKVKDSTHAKTVLAEKKAKSTTKPK